MTTAIVLVGAPGAGKSSVLEALGSRLEREGKAYGSIESEQLAMGWPLLDADVWIPSLADVLERQRAAGRDRFLVAATPENAAELSSVAAVVPATSVAVVSLTASPDVVAARIDAREPDTWPGKRRLIEHARALAVAIPALPGIDTIISTVDRDARDVADEVYEMLGSLLA